jgi:predicted membrane protein
MNAKRATENGLPGSGNMSWLSLLVALAIMIGITAWPQVLVGQHGVDHWAAMALFWAMSAGFVRGVGFQPHGRLWRYAFSVEAFFLALLLAAGRRFVVG